MFCALLCIAGAAYSQSIDPVGDTLVWRAETLTDTAADSTRANESEFVTYGSSKIIWTQNGTDSNTVFEFTITNANDHWSNDGYVIFTTTRKNKTQSFRFEQVGSEIRIRLTYPDAGGERTLVFVIDEVSPLQD